MRYAVDNRFPAGEPSDAFGDYALRCGLAEMQGERLCIATTAVGVRSPRESVHVSGRESDGQRLAIQLNAADFGIMKFESGVHWEWGGGSRLTSTASRARRSCVRRARLCF